MTQADLIDKAKIAQDVGAAVELVGSWMWATFATKPSEGVRQALKDAGYHWNNKRKLWQFAGVPCRYSRAASDELRAKYGAAEMEATEGAMR